MHLYTLTGHVVFWSYPTKIANCTRIAFDGKMGGDIKLHVPKAWNMPQVGHSGRANRTDSGSILFYILSSWRSRRAYTLVLSKPFSCELVQWYSLRSGVEVQDATVMCPWWLRTHRLCHCTFTKCECDFYFLVVWKTRGKIGQKKGTIFHLCVDTRHSLSTKHDEQINVCDVLKHASTMCLELCDAWVAVCVFLLHISALTVASFRIVSFLVWREAHRLLRSCKHCGAAGQVHTRRLCRTRKGDHRGGAHHGNGDSGRVDVRARGGVRGRAANRRLELGHRGSLDRSKHACLHVFV